MKQKTEKIQRVPTIWAAVPMVVFGWFIIVFFGLALGGFLISEDKQSTLVVAIIAALCLYGGVVMVRKGRRGIRQYKEEKAWAKASAPPQPRTVFGIPQKPVTPIPCESCGAVGEPDEKGCCEYCGMPLNKKKH
ncbi:MAG: hypothetical protein RSF82_00860 [Angelakisella sp.]